MREMKDSGIEWIGIIPKNWKTDRIKHHFKIASGTTPKSDDSDLWDGEIVWITPADFKTEDIFVVKGHRNLSEIGFISSSLSLIPAGNIIFSKRAPIGQVVINGVDLCTNQGCLSAIPYDCSDVRYYRYVMSVATEEFEILGSGTTFKEISAGSFGNVVLPCPDIAMQKKIANYLDSKCSKIDAIITKQKQIIEKLREYKLSIITETVTKGLNPNVEMKDSGVKLIGMIPLTWGCVKVKQVTSVVTDGAHISPETDNGLYDFISTVDLEQDLIHFEDCLKTSVSSYKYLVSTGCKPQVGDVLISKDGSVGRTAIVNEDREFVISSSLVIMRPLKDKITSEYLNYCLQANYTQETLNMLMHGAGLRRVSVGKNANLMITLPPLEEQILISQYLDKICKRLGNEIEKRHSITEKLLSYKKSLIYEVVTGKKEV